MRERRAKGPEEGLDLKKLVVRQTAVPDGMVDTALSRLQAAVVPQDL